MSDTIEGTDGALAAPRTEFRSGFVAVVGLPSSGKSTLINSFLEREPLITSKKPQTTRFHIRCIATTKKRQVVFVDTPGWHQLKGHLERYMLDEILKALDGIDVLLYLVDATRPQFDRNVEIWQRALDHAPGVQRKIMAVTKVDLVPKLELLPLLERLWKACSPDDIVPLSAVSKDNLDGLDGLLTEALPPGPKLYPDDLLVDRPDDFVFAEFIREQLHRALRAELPFSVAVTVDKVTGGDKRVKVEATIHVERESQRAIVIGKGGDLVQDVRRKAAERIRRFTGKNVTLAIHVKTTPDWSEKPGSMQNLGYL